MSATTPKGISTDVVARMRRAGLTRSAIARACGCSMNVVHYHLVKAGLARLSDTRPDDAPRFRCQCGGVSSRPEGHGHCAPLGLLQGVA